MASAVVLIGFYLVALFADFLAYADPQHSSGTRTLMPPQMVHIFDGLSISPHVHPVVGYRDPVTFEKTYTVDTSQNIPVEFFAKGYEYKLFGVHSYRHPSARGQRGQRWRHPRAVRHRRAGPRHLLAPDDRDPHVVDDRTGRRHAQPRLRLDPRRDLGYYGGIIDTVIQRLIEIIRSVPTIPFVDGPRRGDAHQTGA